MKFVLPPLSALRVRDMLSDCDESKSWAELRRDMDLSQDLLQATYRNGLVLDVGWYEDNREDSVTATVDAGGAFCVACIRQSDWDHPVLSIMARDFDELRIAIRLADALATDYPS